MQVRQRSRLNATKLNERTCASDRKVSFILTFVLANSDIQLIIRPLQIQGTEVSNSGCLKF